MKKKNQKFTYRDLQSQSATARERTRGRASGGPMGGGYVIGVDGGGTKTIAALANLKGKILKLAKTGPSNLRNVGIKKAAENIALAIKKVLPKKGKILSTFIALAAVEEEYKFKKERIKKEILKEKGVSKISKGKIEIGSDQVIAFRAGTDDKDGVVLISGTGCVARGWKGNKEAKVSGWGWLDDEGSGFWAGQRGFQAVLKELDGRGPKTKITKLIFKEWKLKNKEDLLKKVYSKNSIRQVSCISRIVDKAAEEGDKIAKSIMKEAGKQLAQATISVIKKLNFKNQKFPLVLVGRMFRSKVVLKKVKSQVKKIAPRVKFIRPKKEPVLGAVKLAIENLK
ncbi:hypothetical protein KJA16_00190 [Patescibacteria group bacterium]|nr:hypothetical protein [Patescibacteria group bacterium]